MGLGALRGAVGRAVGWQQKAALCSTGDLWGVGGGSIQGERAPWGRGLFGAPWGPEEQRGAQAAAAEQAVRAVVLVPSKELGLQVVHSLRCMAAFCARQLRVADVCAHGDAAALR